MRKASDFRMRSGLARIFFLIIFAVQCVKLENPNSVSVTPSNSRKCFLRLLPRRTTRLRGGGEELTENICSCQFQVSLSASATKYPEHARNTAMSTSVCLSAATGASRCYSGTILSILQHTCITAYWSVTDGTL
jgi:hypothetical protein